MRLKLQGFVYTARRIDSTVRIGFPQIVEGKMSARTRRNLTPTEMTKQMRNDSTESNTLLCIRMKCQSSGGRVCLLESGSL